MYFFLQSISQILPDDAKSVLLDDWRAQGSIFIVIICFIVVMFYYLHQNNKKHIAYLEQKIKEGEKTSKDNISQIIKMYEDKTKEQEIDTKKYFELAACSNETQRLLLDNLKEVKKYLEKLDNSIKDIGNALKVLAK